MINRSALAIWLVAFTACASLEDVTPSPGPVAPASLPVTASPVPSAPPTAAATATPTSAATKPPSVEPTPAAPAAPPPTPAPRPTLNPEALVGYRASYSAPSPAAMLTGVRAPVSVTVTNTGTRFLQASGDLAVQVSTHTLDVARAVVVAEGPRTNLAADIGPGASADVTVFVDAPPFAAEFILQFDLVVGDVWFSSLGSRPAEVRFRTWSKASASISYRVSTIAQSAPGSLAVMLVNNGLAGYGSTGRAPVTLSSHWLDDRGNALLWDGPRATLPYLAPGAGAMVSLPLASPPSGTRQLAVDLVQEGLGWLGVAVVRPVTLVP